MECAAEGCAALALAKGWCKYHYKVAKYGRAPRPTRGMTLSQRLEHYTNSTGGPDACWIWTGHTDGFGYGMIGTPTGKQRAHRVRWALTFGPIPDGLQVLHRCDTPACNSPKHLFSGTHLDNMADRAAKGRGNQPKGERAAKARLTPEIIRRVRDGGESPSALAKELGITVGTIHHIRRRLTWRHLD